MASTRKKVIVTGANGQLGSEIRQLAPQTDFECIYTDIDTLDLLDSTATDEFFRMHPPDFIINCAAYTAVDKAEEEPALAHQVNAELPARLAQYAARNKGMLIHVSTDYVFGGTHFRPLREDDPTGPESSYGKTKLEGEKAIREMKNVLILRTSWLYSSFGNNFVKSMVRYTSERDELRIVFDQVGSPTYAADLAGAILEIIANPGEKIVPGIYHYSNEGVCSWYDLVMAIREMTGATCNIVPIETKDYPLPAPRPHYSVMNKEKIKKQFGLEIPYWKDSLEKCMTILKSDHNG